MRKVVLLVFLIILVANAGPVAGAELKIRIEGVPLERCGAASVRLHMLDSDPSQAKPEDIDRPINGDLPLTVTIEVPRGLWEASVSSSGCWSSSVKQTVRGQDDDVVVLRVWEQSALKGGLRVPGDRPRPEEIKVSFAPAFKDGTKSEPKGEVLCPVGSNNVFLCKIPSETLDLRVSARGYAPHYFWQVEANEGERAHNLGGMSLRPGASMSGWLVADQGPDLKFETLKVGLVPQGIAGATNPSEEALRQAMHIPATVSENGFFQLDSLDSGEYLLTVTGPSVATESVAVQIVEGSESQLRDPILLRTPMEASFIVDPPIDHYGQNWNYELSRVDRYRSFYAEVAGGEVPADGWFDASPVTPSLHLVKIRDSQGQEVFIEMFNLAEAPMPITIEIGMVPVGGTVRIGDEPIAARIWFGGQFGAEKIEAVSDEYGQYQAILPHDGSWLVEVVGDRPPVRKKIKDVEVPKWDGEELVEVDLRLPNTRLVGTVQDEDGSAPGEPASVYVTKSVWADHVSQRIERDGTFEFLGLDEDLHQVHAKSATGQTETVAIALGEDEERSITLTLRKQIEVVGRVVDESGKPVPGAFAVVQATDQSFIPVRRSTADGEGRFSAHVPADTNAVNITVASPGRTLGVFRFPLTKDEKELLVRLPAEGGNIALRLGGKLLDAKDHELVFFRNGIPFSEGEIWGWRSIHDQPTESDGLSLTFPSLVPGSYEACFIPLADYPAQMLGLRTRENCARGELTFAGELELDLSDQTPVAERRE